MARKKPRKYSLQEKIKILENFDQKSKTKNTTEIAAELQLPVSTLRTIVQKREEIKEIRDGKRQRQKVGKFDKFKLETVLLEWLRKEQASKRPINDLVICEKALEFAASLKITGFNAPKSWIDRFKRRHGIVYSQISTDAESVAEQDVDTLMATLPALLQNYEPQDIFSAEEFLLFYKIVPGKSDVKASKEKLTVLACANSDGSEKLRLLVIGKSKNPRCFKIVRSLPVTYDGQFRASMTGLRFTDWLKTLDDKFQIECRRIILFINDSPTHPKDVQLKNIKLVFVPASATRKLQPMNQGIIKKLGQDYKTRLMKRFHEEEKDPDNKRPLDVHNAILNIAATWNAIKPETIQNCFKKAGLRNSVIIEDENSTERESFSNDDEDEVDDVILSNTQSSSSSRVYASSIGETEGLVITKPAASLSQTKLNDYFK